MKHTGKRRAFAQRPCPIGLTPFLGGVANRRIQQRPGPPQGGFYILPDAPLSVNSRRLMGGFIIVGVQYMLDK